MSSPLPGSLRQGQGATRAAPTRSIENRHGRRRHAHRLSFLLFLSFAPALSLLLANRVAAQGNGDTLVNSIGAATLAGEIANSAQGAADQAAAAGSPASAKVLTEAERQAKLDRVLSFLSAGNIFVGNYQVKRGKNKTLFLDLIFGTGKEIGGLSTN
jgi:hypothetical protein